MRDQQFVLSLTGIRSREVWRKINSRLLFPWSTSVPINQYNKPCLMGMLQISVGMTSRIGQSRELGIWGGGKRQMYWLTTNRRHAKFHMNKRRVVETKVITTTVYRFWRSGYVSHRLSSPDRSGRSSDHLPSLFLVPLCRSSPTIHLSSSRFYFYQLLHINSSIENIR